MSEQADDGGTSQSGDRHIQQSPGPDDHELATVPANQADAEPPTEASTEEGSEPDSVDHPARRRIFGPRVATLRAPVVMLVGAAASIAAIRWLWGAIFPTSWRALAYVVVALALAVGAVAIIAGSRLRARGRLISGGVATDAGIALLAGAVVGLVLLPIEEDRFDREQTREEHRADHQEQLEDERNINEARRDDIRFVREVVIQGAPTKPFSRLDLAEAPLAGLDLHDATLVGANLRDADLARARLGNADLTGANLRDADLRGADLTCVDLTGADLRRADLTGADLGGADLTGIDFLGIDLSCVDLGGVDYTDLDLDDLGGANLRGARLRDVDLTDASLAGVNLAGVDLSGVDLSGVDVTPARYDETTTWPEGFQPPR